jgi:hypothetical protein
MRAPNLYTYIQNIDPSWAFLAPAARGGNLIQVNFFFLVLVFKCRTELFLLDETVLVQIRILHISDHYIVCCSSKDDDEA